LYKKSALKVPSRNAKNYGIRNEFNGIQFLKGLTTAKEQITARIAEK
jgi:hypothetical protein